MASKRQEVKGQACWRGFTFVKCGGTAVEGSARQPEAVEPVTEAKQVADALAGIGISDRSVWIERLISAGVCADRWSSPDVIAQLKALADSQIKTKAVVCSGVDLDPALPVQQTLMLENPLDVAAGAAAVAKIAGAGITHLIHCDTPSRPQAAALASARNVTGVRAARLDAGYPLAHPSLLLQRLLKLRLPPNQLPTQAGVVLLDAAAAFAIGRFIVHGQAMTHVPIGIYDPLTMQSHLLAVPKASAMESILAALGFQLGSREIRQGHVLRDQLAAPDLAVGSHELTFFVVPPRPKQSASACLRCGWCVEACPVNIHPALLLDAAQTARPVAAALDAGSCIECGICTHVCPSRLPLMEVIGSLKPGADKRRFAAVK